MLVLVNLQSWFWVNSVLLLMQQCLYRHCIQDADVLLQQNSNSVAPLLM